MKEAIGGSWLFTIVIVMVILFSSYVSLSTNYSRCYNIKDRIINIIELEGGLSDTAVTKINQYMNNIGYSSSSKICTVEDETINGKKVDYIKMKTSNCTTAANCRTTSGEANYCIARIGLLPKTATGRPDTYYYKVVVFFQLPLPVIRSLFLIRISGETSQIVGSHNDALFA